MHLCMDSHPLHRTFISQYKVLGFVGRTEMCTTIQLPIKVQRHTIMYLLIRGQRSLVSMATKYLFRAFGGSGRCISTHLSKNDMKFASANEHCKN